jgi:hypothetical protein
MAARDAQSRVKLVWEPTRRAWQLKDERTDEPRVPVDLRPAPFGPQADRERT